MKKFNLYLWLIALVGMITSCSQDETAGLQADESNRVTIGAAVNQGIQTRAASVTIPDGYKLRYVLEVWSTGDNAACIYKYEKPAENAQAVEFTFDLTTTGDYKALLWADYVTGTDNGTTVQATADLNEYTHYTDVHYTTASNLKNISLAKTSTNYVINDDSRDAFFQCVDIKKGVGAFAENVELTRPFGQINVIEKTTDLLKKVAKIELTYNVPQTFNVADGTVGSNVEVKPTVSKLPTATTDRKANLFYDFIFAPTTGQTTMESIAMTFTSSDNTLQIEDFSIPANMPVERNKRTNISGNIIHTSTAPSYVTNLSVTVSDVWSDGTTEKDVDPKVGDYYYDDGTYSTTLDTKDGTRTCIGIVYEVNADGNGGKIVGLTEAVKDSSKKWSSENVETGATNTTDGRANMAAIAALIANSDGNKSWDTYPAFKWVAGQNGKTNGGWEDTDKWYLPAKDELSALYTAYDTYGKDNFNAKLTTANGTALSKIYYYWSSTESDTDYCWYTSSTGSGTNTAKKESNSQVRCIRQF